MKNVMEIDGYKALMAFDLDINQFRGEFVDLNGGRIFMRLTSNRSNAKARSRSKSFSTCAVKTA